MAESIVSLAAQRIGSLLIQEGMMFLDVEDQVRGLQEELELMQQYLQDADAKQEAVGKVGVLIGQIRNVAYDAEDLIDYYILKVQPETPDEQRKRSCLMSFACFVRNAPHVYDVGKQIQTLQTSVKQITGRLESYGVRRVTELGEGFRSSSSSRHGNSWKTKPRSYPYDDDDGEYVVGLGKDIRELVGLLTCEEKDMAHVISIVGMGGSGKTTLARKLYNHSNIKDWFDCTAWVFISQEWSTQHVLSQILRKVGSHREMADLHPQSSVEELVDKLRNILENKSYLVILDDVWRKEALQEILPALPRGNINRGSKIIITTRNRELIQLQNIQKNLHIHEIQPLSEGESWELFSKITLSHRETICNMESFEKLGREMLEKCDGLPLAIVALAGILSTRGSITEWQQVSEVVRLRVMERTCTHTYGRVGDLLALSYDDLPYDLKPCFLHLGLFPEDCRIPTGMVTRMWMAEGLVAANREMSLEDVAMQRLEELSHRFLIQVVRTNFKREIKAIRMHDLLRDLCVQKAKEQSFLQIYTPLNHPPDNDVSLTTIAPRRAALHSSISLPTQVLKLRSLVLLTRSSLSHTAYASKELLNLRIVDSNFKLLRLLNIWGIKTVGGTLPSQIGSLIHLRYLGLRATNISELPTSIENLRNLLTLDYRNVETATNVHIRIPDVLWKLKRLRHLFLPMECPWGLDVLKLSTMRKLRTLWGLKKGAGSVSDWLSWEMPKLSTNLKKLKIAVSTENELKAAFSCPSLMSDRLHTFHCKLTGVIGLSDVEPLSPRYHLHKLILVGAIRMQLSLLLPVNLITLELKDSMLMEVNPMAALGRLAHLKLLRLSKSFEGTTWSCDPHSFPQLEELYLESLQNLEKWIIEKGAMPCLKKLDVTSCWQLREFPQGLKFVTTLQLFEFSEMPTTFSEEAIGCGWWQKLRLPHNCGDIIKHSDSPVDCYSIRKLYEQLTAGIFLDNKTKKYWVTKQPASCVNCFMVYASDLRITPDGTPLQYIEQSEDDGTLVTAAKLECSEPWREVQGKFYIANLSLNVRYEIAWVIMFERSANLGCNSSNHVKFPKIRSGLVMPDGRLTTQQLMLDQKPVSKWMQVRVGEFDISPGCVSGELQLSLRNMEFDYHSCCPLGLVVKGFSLTPRLHAIPP